MAKMYRHPEGGSFYDAFGGKIGEVEEIWAGDSFDRNATLSFCADGMNYDAVIKGITSQPKVISAQDCGEVTFSCDLASQGDVTVAKSASGTNYYNDINIASDVECLRDAIDRIEAQIGDLQRNFVPKKGANELRSVLKTLHYKREIE